MARKRKGLGSLGVDALLTPKQPLHSGDASGGEPGGEVVVAAGERIADVGIEQIRPGRYQPRLRMDDEKLDELAASIRSQGLIQPLVVRKVNGQAAAGTEYELIAGERRWRAAQRAGLERVPAVIREADESNAAALSLIENIQREDLSALEEAGALQQLVTRFNLKHQEIANTIGRSRTAVTNLLRLLELAPDARELLESGALEMGHARVLLRLPRDRQRAAGQNVIEKRMTVREAEEYVENLLENGGRGKGKRPPRPPRPPEITALERELSDRLGTPVSIRHGRRGGKVIIRYGNLDILDGVLEKVRK